MTEQGLGKGENLTRSQIDEKLKQEIVEENSKLAQILKVTKQHLSVHKQALRGESDSEIDSAPVEQ